MAQGIGNFIDRIQLGDDEAHQIAIGSSAYGVCSSLGDTAEKVVSLPGFTLNPGTTIHIKFIHANNAQNPTLSVNDTAAKPIFQYGNVPVGTNAETDGWKNGAILTLTYDGIGWIRDSGYNTDTLYNLPLATDEIRGGVQIGYTTNTNNQNYAVELNNEQMFVHVPWTDTKYSAAIGGGLTLDGNTFSVANSGITNTMLQGFIENDKLVNSTITICNTEIALGGAISRNALVEALNLSGAMHLIGTTNINITDGSNTNPEIEGYTTRTPGDVIIDKNSAREYVWTSIGQWELLGQDASTTYDTGIPEPGANRWASRIEQDSDRNIRVTMAALDTRGTWEGNANTATTSTYIKSTNNRDITIYPNELSAAKGVRFDFLQKDINGSTINYAGVMSYRPYADQNDWSGGPAHQLAFDGQGLYWRKSTGSTSWDTWKSLAFTDSNVASATQLVNTHTIWGQNFNGANDVIGNMTNVGPVLSLPENNTHFQFKTSNNSAANGYFGRLGLNSVYTNIDLTNYTLDVGGNMRISDTIYRTYTASESSSPMIQMNSANYNNWLWQIDTDSTLAQYRYGLKYIVVGSNSNYLHLYANKQNNTEILAVSINQAGQVGIGAEANSQYKIYINGNSYFNNNMTINGNITFPIANRFDWNNTESYQRLIITDDNLTNTDVFTFQQSTDNGQNYNDLFVIKDNGSIVAYGGIGIANIDTSSGIGISLYGGATTGAPTYGIMFASTTTFGTHGAIAANNATYFTIADISNCGWIFRRGTTNVASIDGTGKLYISQVYIGNSNIYGSEEQPIYWNNGVPTPTVYALKATIEGYNENDSANRLAYYQTGRVIAQGAATTDGQYLGNLSYVSIGQAHQNTYRLLVAGNSYLNGTTTIKEIIHFDNDGINNGSWTSITGTAPTIINENNTTSYTDAIIGASILTLGNNKIGANSASGVANNSQGYLHLYSDSSDYAQITSYTGDKTRLYPIEGISLPTNKIGLMFRPDSSSNYTHISYQSNGDEALVAATQNINTSFIFINGESYINVNNARWRSLTPAIQIKNNSIIIGKLIDTNATPNYKLEVTGTSYFSDITTHNNHIIPASDNNFTLGTNNYHWKKLYIGNTNTYGDEYTPIYWNDGVPTAATMAIKMDFTIAQDEIGIILHHEAFTTNSIVTQIIIKQGEQYLNSAIEWESNIGQITLRCAAVNGPVVGYIIVIRGAELNATSTSTIVVS